MVDEMEGCWLLIVVVFMCTASVMICHMVLMRFRSGEFFSFCSLVLFWTALHILFLYPKPPLSSIHTPSVWVCHPRPPCSFSLPGGP